ALDLTRFRRSSDEYKELSEGLGDLGDSITLSQLAMRQGVQPELILRLLPDEIRATAKIDDLKTALADSVYGGYIQKQNAASERVNHHDGLKVPRDFLFK